MLLTVADVGLETRCEYSELHKPTTEEESQGKRARLLAQAEFIHNRTRDPSRPYQGIAPSDETSQILSAK